MEQELITNFDLIGKGLLSIGALGSAIAVALIFSSHLAGVSRNPEARGVMFKDAVVGAALAELMGLLCVMMMFVL